MVVVVVVVVVVVMEKLKRGGDDNDEDNNEGDRDGRGVGEGTHDCAHVVVFIRCTVVQGISLFLPLI